MNALFSSIIYVLCIYLTNFNSNISLLILYNLINRVYPQDTRNTGDNTKTYYAVRDIKLIRNDPLLQKYFEFETWRRKVRKSVDKGYKKKQENLIKFSKPEFKYDHLVKERYPSFRSCLTDLDDCLSLMFMFRQMPSGNGITDKVIQSCQQLTDEFMTFISKARALRKVFVSIRGIYYQAQIEGVDVTWITPFNFPLTIPQDEDSPFFIFEDYLTFYSTVLKFVNFKLFHSIGIAYPIQNFTKSDPRTYLLDFEHSKVDIERIIKENENFDEKSTEEKIKIIQNRLVAMSKIENYIESNSELEQLKKSLEEVEKDDIALKNAKVDVFDNKLNAETVFLQRSRSLFENMVFFISNECPVNALDAAIRSFGGQTVFNKDAENITHFVVDRPKFNRDSRRYEAIQPQWIFDCINSQLLLPVQRYKPGVELPPHLSPFVEYKEGDYVPQYAEEILEIKKKEILAIRRLTNPDLQDEEDEKLNENELEKLIKDEDNVESVEQRYQRELNSERSGVKYEDFINQEKEKKSQREFHAFVHHGESSRTDKSKQEKTELKEVMLSSKQKKIYKVLKEKQERLQKRDTKIRQRRAELDRASALHTNSTPSSVTYEAIRETEDEKQYETESGDEMEHDEDDFEGLNDLKDIDDDEALDISDDEAIVNSAPTPVNTPVSSKKRKHEHSSQKENKKRKLQ